MLELNEKSGVALYVQLYRQIKERILRGDIPRGAKLVSSRALARELKVSRNTVELAYEQLCAEGLVSSRPRSGYYAEAPEAEAFVCPLPAPPRWEDEPEDRPAFDLRSPYPGREELPYQLWQRLMNRCFRDCRDELAREGFVFGEPGLRIEIQKHLQQTRGVACAPEQVVVAADAHLCLAMAGRLLRERGAVAAVEQTFDPRMGDMLRSNGFSLRCARSDGEGMRASALEGSGAALVCVTPSGQCPTGVIMSRDRRQELADWAAANGAYLLEQDENSYFRHQGKPIPAIQSLAPGQVLYFGSFSQLLFPSGRVAYMVVPRSLMGGLRRMYGNYAPFVPFLTQKTLELFIREGYLEGHVRRVVKRQKEKRALFCALLEEHLGSAAEILPGAGGLWVLVRPRWETTEEALSSAAVGAGLAIRTLGEFSAFFPGNAPSTAVLTCAGLDAGRIGPAVERLRGAWLKK